MKKILFVVICCILLVGLMPPITANAAVTFSIGDKVRVINTLSTGLAIRNTAAGSTILGRKYDSDQGTVIGGPVNATLDGLVYTWWQIRLDDDGLQGWSAGGYPSGVDYLQKVTIIIAASINNYTPNSPVNVTVGNSIPISVTFTNTGNTALSFIAGATIWDSNGNQVANYSQTLSSPLQPGQQTTVYWSHPVNQAGDYYLQFGIWKATPYIAENLLDKKPSPSQKLIIGENTNPPPTPVILSPGSGSEPGPVIGGLTPNCQWNAVPGADYYALAISKYPYGPSNVFYNPQQIFGTSHQVPAGILTSNGKYRWQIQVHTSMGWSQVSNILYFQTSSLTLPETTQSIPSIITITGKVIVEGANSIEGVQVILYRGSSVSNPTALVTPDASGRYEFKDLPTPKADDLESSYFIYAVKQGYAYDHLGLKNNHNFTLYQYSPGPVDLQIHNGVVELMDLFLSIPKQTLIEWVYQPNGSTDFSGSGLTHGMATLMSAYNTSGECFYEGSVSGGFVFNSQHYTNAMADLYFSHSKWYPSSFWANNGDGGIHDMGNIPLENVTVAPDKSLGVSGFKYYNSIVTEAVLGHTYCVLTADGKSYAKFRVTEIADAPVSAPFSPILISTLTITPEKDFYEVGETITGRFTIINRGTEYFTFDILTIGGRLNGGCPSKGCPDFTPRNIALWPNEVYQYEGTLTLKAPGNYNFFVAYHIESPTPDEIRLLDSNNWNTSIEPGLRLTNANRISTLIVPESREEGSLGLLINRLLNLDVKYPPYLLNPEGFSMSVAVVWMNFTDWATQSKLNEMYDKSYFAGIDYSCLSRIALIHAKSALDRGDYETAKDLVDDYYRYNKLSYMCFQTAINLFYENTEVAIILAQGIRDAAIEVAKGAYILGCSTTSGNVFVCIESAKVVDLIASISLFAVDYVYTDKDEAAKAFTIKIAVELLFSKLDLGGTTLEQIIANKVGAYTFSEIQKIYADEALQFAYSKILKEYGIELSEQLSKVIFDCIYTKGLEYIKSEIHSPVKLTIIDSKGNISGVQGSQLRQNIPGSVVSKDSIIIFFPRDNYTYNITGTNSGTYDFSVTLSKSGKLSIMKATQINISNNLIHQYRINWGILSEGKLGVTLQIDANGDGKFEKSITTDYELTQDELVSAVGKEELPFWIWIAVGFGCVLVMLIAGILIGRRLTRRKT